MKVLFAVTHLLGTGHLARTLTLARACAQAGHAATVLSGGMPAAHLDQSGVTLIDLPPLGADGVDFSRLLDADGAAASDDYLAARQRAVKAGLDQTAPDILITELFPFGRRSLRAEFTALLQAAQQQVPRPLVLSSIRDILAPPSKPRKAAFAADMIAQFYDGVLVHGDPAITPLDLSWPVDAPLRAKLHYTGVVAPPPAGPHPEALGSGEILVSAGGGDVGQTLFATAVEAAKADPNRIWRLLVGGTQAEARVAALRQGAGDSVIVEPARPDFRQMLAHAAASVSMCGYNTAQDILQSGCAAVFVPFDAGGEVEQTLRAEALSKLDQIEVLRTADLSARALLGSLTAVQSSPPRSPVGHQDGARETVRLIEQMARKRA
ncbi:MAG: glycosyltransferase [Pseudomonadota bacterium]